ncbi:MAG: hypothetical protein A3C71_02735 [Candidatus Yanofskybacteria bacterium RIFCSPHIGHO2_02_FULL_43_15c]|uniref:Non-canonical purine NTP pyrophosphatase n=2 Tax=Candidatus Yanofskyibacteriota TaxID=1752733 RepID=A0A1F8ECM7_9BACT|nr:MAG: hypothetical protein A2649_00080 [Candidatus Yanofskybacteria bacterium RIFCSPHIGHO2_01_FULL_41_26]OGN12748.1 MAG: hypothetical protein A3C71_02735 [Candidatus Yanofskybacteria bacterium RIFCSPHIGHO2_02_FULL_43_15c]OGN21447.1 MAG: hypothetical protein A2915_01995 [Candidatus Yanofskybacteria bacterium RIFCSPLOWO2_01_FULL_41_34]
MKILIATKNPAKAKEVEKYLGDNFEKVSLADFPDTLDVKETEKTFLENAVLKAKSYFELFGIPAVSDDGGLEIDALNGEPGVMSRRWPGHEATDQELIDLVLYKLKNIPQNKRTAHLRTVGVYYDGKNILHAEGSIDGYIVEKQTAPCEKGYPFRAIFWIPQFNKLYQDLTHEEHEEINHRRFVYSQLSKKMLALEK